MKNNDNRSKEYSALKLTASSITTTAAAHTTTDLNVAEVFIDQIMEINANISGINRTKKTFRSPTAILPRVTATNVTGINNTASATSNTERELKKAQLYSKR